MLQHDAPCCGVTRRQPRARGRAEELRTGRPRALPAPGATVAAPRTRRGPPERPARAPRVGLGYMHGDAAPTAAQQGCRRSPCTPRRRPPRRADPSRMLLHGLQEPRAGLGTQRPRRARLGELVVRQVLLLAGEVHHGAVPELCAAARALSALLRSLGSPPTGVCMPLSARPASGRALAHARRRPQPHTRP